MPRVRCHPATFATLAAAICIGVGAAPGGAAQRSPVWVTHTASVSPGMPMSFVLDPSGAGVCWVSLKGPSSGPATVWRFQPHGLRLSLVLFTHADAAAGAWQLGAQCQGAGGRSPVAVARITVLPGGGSGALSTHADMRVAVLRGRADPKLGLWIEPENDLWGFQSLSGAWVPAVYLWVAIPNGYEEQQAVPVSYRKGSPCTTNAGHVSARLTRAGTGYRIQQGVLTQETCAHSTREISGTIATSPGRMTVALEGGDVWKYVRYKG